MVNKKVYFFKVNLYNRDGEEQDFRDLGPLLQDIVNRNAIVQHGYHSLDITVGDEYTHVVWDIFNYENTRLFGRLSKQQPSNSFLTRDYATLEKEDMNIPDETREGIEKYTYGSLDYATGIFSIVSAQGAPTEKAIANVFWKYNRDYYVQVIPVPNADAINAVYQGDDASVTRVEVEIPIPEAGVLQNIFGWNEQDILDVLERRNLDMVLTVKPVGKRGCITRDSEETRGLLDCIFGNMDDYRKGRVRAKTRTLKLREYDLFDQNFSYPIEITTYHIVDGRRVYYTVDELVELFRNSIVECFELNRGLLTTIIGR